MYTVMAKLKSMDGSYLSQSRYYEDDVPKLKKEKSNDYEIRTWRERLHYNDQGEIYIPAMSFKFALSATAQRSGKQIPGRGKSTYTKFFESGIIIARHVMTGVNKEDAFGEAFMVPSDGKRGGSKRVKKIFPTIREWQGDLIITVLDDTITKDVLYEMLCECGSYNGIGRFRPQTGGYYGRFEVVEFIVDGE